MGKYVAILLGFLFWVQFAAAETPPSCVRNENSLPDSARPAGVPDAKNPIEHIIVVMQENHSFDNYLGRLNQSHFYGSEVDGVLPTMWNPDKQGKPVYAFHEKTLCVGDPVHSWNAMHINWNGGKNDQFVAQNDARAIGYFDEGDLPFYYALADQFAIADRYFSSVLTSTFPNRFFLLTASAFGHIKNDFPSGPEDFSQKTIFDVLNQYGVSWRYYTDDLGYLALFRKMHAANLGKMKKIADYQKDLQSGNLPQIVFIDANFEGQDEHPNADIQIGQEFVADRVHELVASAYWRNSVLFLAYDEGGGFFDHVSPPLACEPDSILPNLNASSEPGRYDRLGFRVPFIAVSPYAKHHYVSHKTYDHASILKFIETKFNLPALTRRDANADGLLDLFDFSRPIFETNLPSGALDTARQCGNLPL